MEEWRVAVMCNDVDNVRPLLDDALAARNVSINPSSADWQRICRLSLVVAAQAHAINAKREWGDYSNGWPNAAGVPLDELPGIAGPTAEPPRNGRIVSDNPALPLIPATTITESCTAFFAAQLGWSAKYRKQAAGALLKFVSLNGDLPVDKITGSVTETFRTRLKEMPRLYGKSICAGQSPLQAHTKAVHLRSELGYVDKADPLFDRRQLGEAEEAAGGMIVSGRHAPTVLEPVKEPLDPVSGRIQGAVDCVLDVPVLFGGDFGCAAPGANLVADGVTVVSLVGQHDLGIGIVLGHEVGEGRAVVGLAGRQEERDWKTLSVGPGMDFGREATARAAKSLILSPPLAPAAQWCARMIVLSAICTALSPPPSARASSIRSHKPAAVQRRYCRGTEFQLPSSSGRSRQVEAANVCLRAMYIGVHNARFAVEAEQPGPGWLWLSKASKLLHRHDV